jgi:cytochrome bd-type quinol oxidase subunit 2
MNVLAGVGLVSFLALLFAIVLLVRKDGSVLSQLAKQASSGRWLLTVTAGFCLTVATVADAYIAIKCAMKDPTVEAKLPFPVSTIFTLSGVVFTFYFVKKEKEDIEVPPNGNGHLGIQGR